MRIGKIQLLQDIVYIYIGPVWVDDIDPVWIITWHRSLSRTLMIPSGIYSPVWVTYYKAYVTVSYSDNTFRYIQIEITFSYSDSTFGYIKLSPVSTSKVFADMKHKRK